MARTTTSLWWLATTPASVWSARKSPPRRVINTQAQIHQSVDVSAIALKVLITSCTKIVLKIKPVLTSGTILKDPKARSRNEQNQLKLRIRTFNRFELRHLSLYLLYTWPSPHLSRSLSPQWSGGNTGLQHQHSHGVLDARQRHPVLQRLSQCLQNRPWPDLLHQR